MEGVIEKRREEEKERKRMEELVATGGVSVETKGVVFSR